MGRDHAVKVIFGFVEIKLPEGREWSVINGRKVFPSTFAGPVLFSPQRMSNLLNYH